MVGITPRHKPLDLEQKISQLEAEVKLYKQLKLTSIERRIIELLDELDSQATPQTKGQRLRERIGIVVTTVALTAIAQGKPNIPLIFQQPVKQEQVSPKPTPTFTAPLAPALPKIEQAKPKSEAKSASKNNEFVTKVNQVATSINADPTDLLTLMLFETAGTLDPTKRGPHVPNQGRAAGLIQFMPTTAQELGTSIDELVQMSQVQQLDYVQQYLVKRGFKGGTLKQLYSTVFAGYPDAPGEISDGYHTLNSAVARMNEEHRPKAIAILEGKDDSFSRKDQQVKFADTKVIISAWSAKFQEDPNTGDHIAGYTVTSPRGWRIHPVTGTRKFHQGVDLGTPVGTPLIAIADGEIECDWWGDAGKVAMFTSEKFPGLRFDLLHLESCLTQPGTKVQVKAGQKIGTTGDAGTGPHLHLAIKGLESGNFLRVRRGWLHWFITGEEPKT